MYILPPFRGPFEYDEVWRHDPLYTAEFWFFEAATRDDRWVACTPELATYFYLPFFNVRTNHNGPTSWGLVREAAAGARAALRGRLGAWTNFTTVLFQQVDYGTCATPPEFAAVRFLTHFGLRRFPAEPSQWARVATGGHSTAPCFVDAAQTLTPGHCWGCGNRLTAALCAEQQNSSEQQRRQQPNRTWTLVFQGQLRDAAGARQELWLRLKDEPGFLVAASRGPGGGGGRDWAALMAASHFCAAPHGDGWGSRLVSALSVGCIPVLMLGDSARPFDALLDYSTFSISVVIEARAGASKRGTGAAGGLPSTSRVVGRLFFFFLLYFIFFCSSDRARAAAGH